MQKKKRVVMIVVATVLCLTLISSCLVSGIFAKYSKKGVGSVTSPLKSFDIKTIVDVPTNSLWGAKSDVSGESGAIQVQNGILNPGDDPAKTRIRLDFINFSETSNFIGKSEVKVRAKVFFKFELTTASASDFTVPSGIGALTADTSYVPFGAYMYASYYVNNNALVDTLPTDTNNDIANVSLVQPWTACTPETYTRNVLLGLISKMDFATTDADGHETEDDLDDGLSYDSTLNLYYVYKDFEPNEYIVFYPKLSNGTLDTENYVTRIYLNFDYPFVYGTGTEAQSNYDEMATYISFQEPTFNITYKGIVEQIQ